ncbi:DUF262 domain-containing protein [Quadrisphaera sp. INWT6]|nr:DUF262 domain-containing protein [Quadrisphaera sp. INWT6]
MQDYLDAQKGAVLEIADQGLISLSNLVESGAIDVSPKFQRRDRWNAEKQSLLIESFLTNIPVPPVYLAEDVARLGSYAVIDGKQRLTAVSTFFADNLVLRGLDRLDRLNGRRYSSLPLSIRNSLSMKNLRTTTLLRQSSEDLKHEVFLRLNTGGEILNAQEIRNVAYRGPLNDLIFELSESPFLREQFKVIPPNSPAFRQMTDAEFVLRFFMLHAHWQTFRGDLRDELDSYMARNRFADEPELRKLRTTFNDCIEAAEAIWGSDSFKRPGRDQALAGMFDAQMVALAGVTASARRKLIKERVAVRSLSVHLFEDEEFEEAVRRATNTPNRVKYRVGRLLRVLREAGS